MERECAVVLEQLFGAGDKERIRGGGGDLKDTDGDLKDEGTKQGNIEKKDSSPIDDSAGGGDGKMAVGGEGKTSEVGKGNIDDHMDDAGAGDDDDEEFGDVQPQPKPFSQHVDVVG